MKELCYVCFYLNYLDVFEKLSDKDAATLVRAMLRYAKDGKEPKMTGALDGLWSLISFHIDHDKQRYIQKCETNRSNGKKGGRPRKNPIQVEADEDALLI